MGRGSRGDKHRMRAKPQSLAVVGVRWEEALRRELAGSGFVSVAHWQDGRSSTAGNAQTSRSPAHYQQCKLMR